MASRHGSILSGANSPCLKAFRVGNEGYHCNEMVRALREMAVRSCIAEPERGPRNWEGRPADREAVCATRRIRGDRGKWLLPRRGEQIDRNFALQFDTGGMDRLHVRGRDKVQRLLLQAAACNLDTLMRGLFGAASRRRLTSGRSGPLFRFWSYEPVGTLFEGNAVIRFSALRGLSSHSRISLPLGAAENAPFRHGLLN